MIQFAIERALANPLDFSSKQKHEKTAEFVLLALLEFSRTASTDAWRIVSTNVSLHLSMFGGNAGYIDAHSSTATASNKSWYTPGICLRLQPSLWTAFLKVIFFTKDSCSSENASENRDILKIIRNNKLVHLSSFSRACRYVDLVWC